jgi:hypothetical protein
VGAGVEEREGVRPGNVARQVGRGERLEVEARRDGIAPGDVFGVEAEEVKVRVGEHAGDDGRAAGEEVGGERSHRPDGASAGSRTRRGLGDRGPGARADALVVDEVEPHRLLPVGEAVERAAELGAEEVEVERRLLRRVEEITRAQGVVREEPVDLARVVFCRAFFRVELLPADDVL